MSLHGAQQACFPDRLLPVSIARDAEESIIATEAAELAEMLAFNQPFPQASS